jgi:hypothetical protein
MITHVAVLPRPPGSAGATPQHCIVINGDQSHVSVRQPACLAAIVPAIRVHAARKLAAGRSGCTPSEAAESDTYASASAAAHNACGSKVGFSYGSSSTASGARIATARQLAS